VCGACAISVDGDIGIRDGRGEEGMRHENAVQHLHYRPVLRVSVSAYVVCRERLVGDPDGGVRSVVMIRGDKPRPEPTNDDIVNALATTDMMACRGEVRQMSPENRDERYLSSERGNDVFACRYAEQIHADILPRSFRRRQKRHYEI